MAGTPNQDTIEATGGVEVQSRFCVTNLLHSVGWIPWQGIQTDILALILFSGFPCFLSEPKYTATCHCRSCTEVADRSGFQNMDAFLNRQDNITLHTAVSSSHSSLANSFMSRVVDRGLHPLFPFGLGPHFFVLEIINIKRVDPTSWTAY